MRTHLQILGLLPIIALGSCDTVSEVVDISPDQIEPPPQVAVGATEHFIKGLGKAGDTVRLLLDAPRVLGAEPQGLAEV